MFKWLVKYSANVCADELKLDPTQSKAVMEWAGKFLNSEYYNTRYQLQRGHKCNRKTINNTRAMINFTVIPFILFLNYLNLFTYYSVKVRR